ncbi:MAG: hypothetical protein RL068_324 [Actinomycetota bacterium]
MATEAKQFPAVVQAMSLILANGLPIAVAISWLAPRLSGFWGEQFDRIHRNLQLGADLGEELTAMAVSVPLAEVAEFSQKLQLALERGAPVSRQLSQLASSLEAAMIRNLTKQAGSNETKMLIPTIFLILPVTVLFAVFPSLLVLKAAY